MKYSDSVLFSLVMNKICSVECPLSNSLYGLLLYLAYFYFSLLFSMYLLHALENIVDYNLGDEVSFTPGPSLSATGEQTDR